MTATVIIKEVNGETHRFAQVTELNVSDDRYAVVNCENGAQFLFSHVYVREIEIQQNKEGNNATE